MLTTIFIALLAVVAFAYVVLPLLFPSQADPLPDDRDPILTDLQEERDALYRAIRELDNREDIAPQRLSELRSRYEAKAAKTLQALDARARELAARARELAPRGRELAARGRSLAEGAPAAHTAAADVPPAAKRPVRVPVSAIVVLGLMVAAAVALPSFILPRIGPEATVTTTDVAAATQLRDLQRAVQTDPSAENLLALGDMYLSLQQLTDAGDTYQRIIDTIDPVPAGAYQRMAVLAFGSDLGRAQSMLELARDAEPDNPDTLFLLSEVAYANGDLDLALDSLRGFLALMPEAPDPSVLARLALLEEATVLNGVAAEDPSEENMLALADAFWRGGDRENAVGIYFNILTGSNPTNAVALARTGEAMLVAGSPQDAVALLERAADAAGSLEALEPDSVLALGNARFTMTLYEQAAVAYAAFIGMVGEAEAGNAPALLESARALAAGLPDPNEAQGQVSGQLVFAANCAVCHGPSAQGGSGPALVGNARAANVANVRDAVTFGRGLMPGFMAQLSEAELESVITYVTQVLAPGP